MVTRCASPALCNRASITSPPYRRGFFFPSMLKLEQCDTIVMNLFKISFNIRLLFCFYVFALINDSVESIQLRMVSNWGTNKTVGRLEVYNEMASSWMRLVRAYWNSHATKLACARLGFSRGGWHVTGSRLVLGTGSYYPKALSCSSSHTDLDSCNQISYTSYPSYNNDIGVLCKGNKRGWLYSKFIDYVYYHIVPWDKSTFTGVPGMTFGDKDYVVLDENWNDNGASVACREAGFPFGRALMGSSAGIYSSNLFVTNVSCTGSESSIYDCSFNVSDITTNDQALDKLAGIFCFTDNNTYGEDRYQGLHLRDSSSQINTYYGEVHIKWYGIYGDVCDEDLSDADATVICRERNYLLGAPYPANKMRYYSSIFPKFLHGLNCTGTETNISQCDHIFPAKGSCKAGSSTVVCFSQEPTVYTAEHVELTSGSYDMVVLGGAKGLISSLEWTMNEASAYCRMLNNNYSIGVPELGIIMLGSILHQPILMSDVSCHGHESTLNECNFTGILSHGVRHDRSTYWRSSVCFPKQIINRQIGISGKHQDLPQLGHVTVTLEGTTGVVCNAVRWTNAEAAVVCRENGYAYGIINNRFQKDDYAMAFFMNAVTCDGNEQSLFDCQYVNWTQSMPGCDSHSVDDAGVLCYNDDLHLKLEDGIYWNEGRISIGVDSHWGTLRYYGFSSTSARIVCRTLGFEYGKSRYTNFGPGSGFCFISHLSCSFNSDTFFHCPHYGFGDTPPTSCSHNSDIGIECFHLTLSGIGSLSLDEFPKTFATHGYTNGYYYANLRMELRIDAPARHVVMITFHTLKLQAKLDGICVDNLNVTDGDSDSDPQLGSFCGTDKPKPIITSSNKCFISFYSDSAIQSNGVLASARSICLGLVHQEQIFVSNISLQNIRPINGTSDLEDCLKECDKDIYCQFIYWKAAAMQCYHQVTNWASYLPKFITDVIKVFKKCQECASTAWDSYLDKKPTVSAYHSFQTDSLQLCQLECRDSFLCRSVAYDSTSENCQFFLSDLQTQLETSYSASYYAAVPCKQFDYCSTSSEVVCNSQDLLVCVNEMFGEIYCRCQEGTFNDTFCKRINFFHWGIREAVKVPQPGLDFQVSLQLSGAVSHANIFPMTHNSAWLKLHPDFNYHGDFVFCRKIWQDDSTINATCWCSDTCQFLFIDYNRGLQLNANLSAI